jgi:hypothetical protein
VLGVERHAQHDIALAGATAVWVPVSSAPAKQGAQAAEDISHRTPRSLP